ncbi:MAG: sigma 54-interacting transcriptional regulator [Lachnospiraceae bacterium]
MAKIKVLVPNHIMEQYSNKIIEEEGMESCEVEVIQTSDSVQAARRGIEQGASVIVARGLQAALIREYTKIPLVEITLTGQELGLLIQQAKKLIHKEVPKIVFIGHSSMFPDTSYMNEIFQIDMTIYNVEDYSMIEQLVLTAVNHNADIIIGGERVVNTAEKYEIQTMFLNAREDSIREALRVAKKLLYTSQIEKENHAQFLTVLDTIYSGILRVNRDKVIVTINHTAELFLNRIEKNMVGRPLEQVIPEIEVEYLDKILESKRDSLNSTIVIEKENYMISIAPIEVDSQVTGAIIIMNQLKTSRKDKKDSLQDNFFSGYVTDFDFRKIETKSQEMKSCIELARMYALTNCPVIIYGETGTQKDLFAQGIHNSGQQKNSHFITFSCNGMNEDQQIRTLFGDNENTGALRQAEFGTLVIRDIDGLYPRCQYRLLRMMRYRMFMKTDIEETPAFDVRIIATAGQDLGIKVNEGVFRADLYYILNTFSLRIPPLRARKEDIHSLVISHLKKYNRKYGKRISLTKGGLDEVIKSIWDGNELQIEGFFERLVLTAPRRNVDEILVRSLIVELYPVVPLTEHKVSPLCLMESPEATQIKQALIENNGSRQKTADAMGISTATLWRKMKKYNISDY